MIGLNGDPYRGRSRSVPSQKVSESAKRRTLENVSFLSLMCVRSSDILELRAYAGIKTFVSKPYVRKVVGHFGIKGICCHQNVCI